MSLDGELMIVLEIANDQMVWMDVPSVGRQIWTKGKMRPRRNRPVKGCINCGKLLVINDPVWRPMSNSNNRSNRLCDGCCQEKINEARGGK
jgi:hypothetical protein